MSQPILVIQELLSLKNNLFLLPQIMRIKLLVLIQSALIHRCFCKINQLIIIKNLFNKTFYLVIKLLMQSPMSIILFQYHKIYRTKCKVRFHKFIKSTLSLHLTLTYSFEYFKIHHFNLVIKIINQFNQIKQLVI